MSGKTCNESLTKYLSFSYRRVFKKTGFLVTAILFTASFNALAGTTLRIGGSGTDLATMRLLAKEFESRNKGVSIQIPPSLGSSGGVRALRAGKLDIAMTSRALKSKEQSPDLVAFKYAQTALVFATANNNPIEIVTQVQLKGIYSGKHPYWPDGRVARPILRPPSDSDTLLLKKFHPWMVASLEQAYERRGIPIATTDQDCADKLENIPGAIGTSTLSLILAEKRDLKALKINGVSPSIKNMTNGQYKMLKNLYVVFSNKPSKEVKQFINFINTKKGRTILEETGHTVVPFSI